MPGLDPPPLDLTAPGAPEAALAILIVAGRYVLQLRDDRPDIPWPAHWGLFGGTVEPSEAPRDAVRRELQEELELVVDEAEELWRVRQYSTFREAMVRAIVFVADVTALWPGHVVSEGQAAGVFDVAALPENTVPLARALVERYHASRTHCETREEGMGGDGAGARI